ncbi:MAG: hypothetical protein NTZ94_12460 [Verrucomicrobia bacterium]|nr:hypothetical protein [Verrucomicrobiota bacterium]
MKTILLIACLSTVGFFAWKTIKKDKVMTPAEEVESCLRRGAISSIELASICDKYPSLVTTKFKNQKITVTGILKKALVKGVDRRDLILEMEGSGKRHVNFTSDVVATKRLSGVPIGSLFLFKKHGGEIYVEQLAATKKDSSVASKLGGFLGMPKGGQTKGGESKEDSVKTETVFAFREMEAYTLKGVFQYIRPGSVEFEWIQPSSF